MIFCPFPHSPSLRALVCALLFAAGTAPLSAEVLASGWLDFNEVKIRLLAERESATKDRLRAGLEIRLAPGYKTYWRSAGDSGVPPVFDFSGSKGIGPASVGFPFPVKFDDGAGGSAWGYKEAVILPIAADRQGMDFVLHLKLDFAVCGTMCIPLSGKLVLDSARAQPAADAGSAALDAAIAKLPKTVSATLGLKITRLAGQAQPKWQVILPYIGPDAPFVAFVEGRGFLDVIDSKPGSAGHMLLTISGQSEPGSDGTFGPVRITYGNSDKSFERMLDLDFVR